MIGRNKAHKKLRGGKELQMGILAFKLNSKAITLLLKEIFSYSRTDRLLPEPCTVFKYSWIEIPLMNSYMKEKNEDHRTLKT